jgi:fructokinase
MKIQREKRSICIGTGLVALDVVINGNPEKPLKLYAGGSCGNVLTILSFFDWVTYPIARLKDNFAAKKLLSDLAAWKTETLLISQKPDGSTPIIIQRIKKDKDGNSIHKFEFKNPDNNVWLPSYKPVLAKMVEEIIKISPVPATFYFDRVNRASIELAKFYKKNGSLIYFEPSSISNNKQFEECLNIADIIKFSNERIKNYSKLYPIQRVPLEIETLGKDGLQYRFSHSCNQSEWKILASYKISFVVDAAGSGDWFSAGIISQIGSKGFSGFKECTEGTILSAMKYGQSLGALNCFFDGARGLMYALDQKLLMELVEKIQKNEMPVTVLNTKEVYNPLDDFNINDLY